MTVNFLFDVENWPFPSSSIYNSNAFESQFVPYFPLSCITLPFVHCQIAFEARTQFCHSLSSFLLYTVNGPTHILDLGNPLPSRSTNSTSYPPCSHLYRCLHDRRISYPPAHRNTSQFSYLFCFIKTINCA